MRCVNVLASNFDIVTLTMVCISSFGSAIAGIEEAQ